YPIQQGLNVVAGASGEWRHYDATDPLFLDERDDQQFDASVGLKLLVAADLYVRPRITYTRNWSNIALYDYDRVTVSIGVRAEFCGICDAANRSTSARACRVVLGRVGPFAPFSGVRRRRSDLGRRSGPTRTVGRRSARANVRGRDTGAA